MPEYPRHLATFDYVGAYGHFLTFCTFERNRLFVTAEAVADRGYERVFRNEEEKIAFIRYVIENPLRAEFVESPLDYPFWGSSTYSREDLLDYLRIVLTDSRRAG